MKKRFKITVEINTDTPSAEEWEKIEDYISNEIDESIGYVQSNYKNRNYSIMRNGTSIKVSMRTLKSVPEPEYDEDGHKVCMCTTNVEEKAQVITMIDHFECRYCGGRWYK